MKIPRNKQQLELPILLAFIGASASLFGFFVLASEMLEGETHTFDRWVLLALRNPKNLADPFGPPWLARAILDITALGSMAVLSLVTAATVTFLFLVRKRSQAWLVLVTIGLGLGASNLLKLFYGRSRPDFIPRSIEIETLSFPSGHAMMSAVVYLTLGALLAREQTQRGVKVFFIALAILLTTLVGFSRIFLAVHWPTDVLAGWAVGAAWAILSWLVMSWFQVRKTPPQ